MRISIPASRRISCGLGSIISSSCDEGARGYLVKDLDVAVKSARAAGADILVAPFPDPIGRDVIIQWPGGVSMQLYVHRATKWENSLRFIVVCGSLPCSRSIAYWPKGRNSFVRGYYGARLCKPSLPQLLE
jgi:hypothetical protein